MTEVFACRQNAVTARLAYRYWEERGRPSGSPHIDWFLAEQTLHAETWAYVTALPFSGNRLGSYEGY